MVITQFSIKLSKNLCFFLRIFSWKSFITKSYWEKFQNQQNESHFKEYRWVQIVSSRIIMVLFRLESSSTSCFFLGVSDFFELGDGSTDPRRRREGVSATIGWKSRTSRLLFTHSRDNSARRHLSNRRSICLIDRIFEDFKFFDNLSIFDNGS